MDKEILKKVRAHMDEALQKIAKDLGLKSLACGKCTYYAEGSFVMKVNGVAAGGVSQEAAAYESMRDVLKLPKLGHEFKDRRSQLQNSRSAPQQSHRRAR